MGQECVLGLTKSVRDEIPGMGRREVSLFLEELDDMKSVIELESAIEGCWDETNERPEWMDLDGMKFAYTEEDASFAVMKQDEDCNGAMTDGEEGEEELNYVDQPRTRCKGKLEEYKLV